MTSIPIRAAGLLATVGLLACSAEEAAGPPRAGGSGGQAAGGVASGGRSGGAPGGSSGQSGQSGGSGGQAGPAGAAGQPGGAGAGGQPGGGGSGSNGLSGSSGQASLAGQAGAAGVVGAAGEGAGGAAGTAGEGGAGASGGPGAKVLLGPGAADFVFELQDLGIGHHTGAALDEAIVALGLGDVIARALVPSALTGAPSWQRVDGLKRPVPMLGEWDYSCLNIKSGEVDGSGLPRDGFPCFDELQGCAPPAHAGQAYERAMAYLGARRDHEFLAFPGAGGFIAHTGHHFLQHPGAAFGAALVESEVGENINSTQAHVAFTRGAARQFGLPWGLDMSPWFAASVTDYWTGDDRVWCEHDSAGNCVVWYSGSDHGHSLSLTRRTWYLAYMGGARHVFQEGASVNFFSSPKASAQPTPLGQLAQEFHTFVQAHPDRGVPHVPFGVVVDFYHGLGLGTWSKPAGAELLWNHFPVSAEQRGTLSLLDTLWPGSLRVSAASEANYMVNGPLGDTVDVLADLSDPTSLAQQCSYRALFLSGPVHWTPAWKASLWNCFLAQGGWLVLDAGPVQDAIFADLVAGPLSPLVAGHGADQLGVADVLAGHVVRVASPDLQGAAVAEVGRRVLPFAITGASFSLSRAGDDWLITLINNRGVDKAPLSAEVLTEGASAVKIEPGQGQSFVSVEALRSAHAPGWTSGAVQVLIDPGDVVVLRVGVK